MTRKKLNLSEIFMNTVYGFWTSEQNLKFEKSFYYCSETEIAKEKLLNSKKYRLLSFLCVVFFGQENEKQKIFVRKNNSNLFGKITEDMVLWPKQKFSTFLSL